MRRFGMQGFAFACAAATALAFCGCGDNEPETAEDSRMQPVASPSCRPMVLEDATFALGVNLDTDQLYRIVDNYTDRILAKAKIEPEESRELKAKIAELKKDPFKNAPKDVQEFMAKCGLKDIEVSWIVSSMVGQIDVVDGEPKLGGLTLAIACNAKLEVVISEMRNKMSEAGEESKDYEETSVEGEKSWRIVPKDSDTQRDLADVNADPFITSLDGKLVLVAMSRTMLARMIRLYRHKEGEGSALKGFSAARGELLHANWSNVGEVVQKTVPPQDIKAMCFSLPGAENIVKGVKSLDIDIKASPDGQTKQLLVLEAGSEEDADIIRTLAKTGLIAARAFVPQDPDVPSEVVDLLKSIKIEGSNGKIIVQNTDLVFALVSAVYPAISSAIASAKTAEMAMKGRNLFVGITQANVERECAGLESVWPHTNPVEKNGEDIAGIPFKSAADYFSALFDMANYKKSNWSPYVVVDTSTIGKTAVAGTKIEAAGLEWCIAANVTDDMPDDIPVLISANFNPALLLRKWDGFTNGSIQLPIGPKSGAAKSLFGDKAVVVIYKGGSTQVLKSRNLNYNNLYKHTPFDLGDREQGEQLMYLTPNGVAKPVGLK